jgi:hypothetical protein
MGYDRALKALYLEETDRIPQKTGQKKIILLCGLTR